MQSSAILQKLRLCVLLASLPLVQLQLRRSVLYSTGHAKSTDLRSNIDY